MKEKFEDYFSGVTDEDIAKHKKEVARVRKNRSEEIRRESKRIKSEY